MFNAVIIFQSYHRILIFQILIENISKNFYSIEPSEILKLPRTIQYSIITNPHLQIKTEDSFLDLICQIIDNQTFSDEIDSKEKIDDISFLEQVEFTRLSEEKLREFLTNYDFNRTTNSLWQKFYECFFIHFGLKPTKIESSHSNQENFEYNENQKTRFEGIIHHLTEKFGGNVDQKGVCKVTSSSTFKISCLQT